MFSRQRKRSVRLASRSRMSQRTPNQPPWMRMTGVEQITKMPTTSSQQLATRTSNMTPGIQQSPASQVMSRLPVSPLLRPGATDEEASKLILWTEGGKKTQFSPAVVERMARATAMKNNAIRLVEAMRCTAQPNKQFRGERLVPSDVGAVSERLALAKALHEAGGSCFDNMEPLIQYTREVANVEKTIDQNHEIYLRQVMVFCAKPLKAFAEVTYPLLQKAHTDLEKMRDKFDSVRRKKDDESTTKAARQQLLDQARVLASLMDELPMHQMNFAKALDSFVRAEASFGGQLHAMSMAVKQPDHRKRWTTSPK